MINVMVKSEDVKVWMLSAECWNEASARSYIRDRFNLELEDMEVISNNHFRFFRMAHGIIEIRIEGLRTPIDLKPKIPPIINTWAKVEKPQMYIPPVVSLKNHIKIPWYKRLFK